MVNGNARPIAPANPQLPMATGVTIHPVAKPRPKQAVSISPAAVSISRSPATVNAGTGISRVPATIATSVIPNLIPANVVAAVAAAPAQASTAAVAAGSGQKVIDIVDLSDDEEPTTPAAPQPVQAAAAVPAGVTQVAYTYKPIAAAGQQRGQIVMSQTPGGGVRPAAALIPVSSSAGNRMTFIQQQGGQLVSIRPQPTHPAPPPNNIRQQQLLINGKRAPAQPTLKISCTNAGIVLSWEVRSQGGLDHGPTKCYQIYAYQEGNQPPNSSLWKKVGDVKALPLPMACTLTQFTRGNKYHFSVRAQDFYNRVSLFSEPQSITLS